MLLLSKKEQQELKERLQAVREYAEKHPVPDELTSEQKKERTKRIQENRKAKSNLQ